MMYFVVAGICLKRDLAIFVRMASYGAVSIIIIAFFVIGVGIYSFSNTSFQILSYPSQPQPPPINQDIQQALTPILLFNTNFSPLAGVLGVGFFLHPLTVSIVRNNLNQSNNERDVCLGYTLVFISYISVGVFGYFGFMGTYFSEYEQLPQDADKPLAQNCIQMFRNSDILAFVLRMIIFVLVFSAFPILQHFFRAGFLKLILGENKVNENQTQDDQE